MRPAILTAFTLLTLVGCRPAPVAPSFPITEVAAPESPDDAPINWPEVNPVSVPVVPAATSAEECGPGGCGPARGERAVVERTRSVVTAPVRVIRRLPVVRRFGR